MFIGVHYTFLKDPKTKFRKLFTTRSSTTVYVTPSSLTRQKFIQTLYDSSLKILQRKSLKVSQNIRFKTLKKFSPLSEIIL